MVGMDVSSTVTHIIVAFRSCRDVLKKLRARPSARSSRKTRNRKDQSSNAELCLFQSLQRGPVEIEQEYSRGLSKIGAPYEIGDAHARTELTGILLRLNSGLVKIISSFLADKDQSKLRFDYQALTALANDSCLDATCSLAQLGQRLYQSQSLNTRQFLQDQNRPRANEIKASKKDQGLFTTPKRLVHGEYIAGVKQNGVMHFAYVRPRPKTKRKVSTSSTESGTNSPSPWLAKCTTSPRVTFNDARPPNSGRQVMESPDSSSATSSPELSAIHRGTARPDVDVTLEAVPSLPKLKAPWPKQRVAQLRTPQAEDLPARRGQDLRSSQPQFVSTPRRRQGYNTESFYSFASDSTKLGEIPMHRWSQPFDYLEAERLNGQAEMQGCVNPEKAQLQRSPGLLARMFRRPGALGTVAEM